MILRCALLLLVTCGLVLAQAPSQSDDNGFQMFNGTVSFALRKYQSLTGKKIIVDTAAASQNISIDTGGRMKPAQTADFIEKSLLLNGFALVPSGPDTLKLIAFSPAKQLTAEGIPVITRPEALPPGDAVVTYIMPLSYIGAEEAVKTFKQIVSLHSYGSVVAVPEAGVVAITESSATIRNFIDLQKSLDVAPSEMVRQSFQLERSDAEEVAEGLREILGLETESGSGGAGAGIPPAMQQGGAGGDQQAAGTTSTRTRPRIVAITRTNRILAMARPVDMAYIESIIEEYDSPSSARNHFSMPVRYVRVTDLLQVARDTILRGAETPGGGNAGNPSQIYSQDNRSDGFQDRSFGSAGMRNNGFGSTGAGSNFGGSGISGNSSLREPEVQQGPISLLAGKTLIIADPVRNVLFASGPPDHLADLKAMIENLDQRPRQIFLSIVIGQLTLGDGVDFGVDLVRSVDGFRVNGRNAFGAGSYKSSIGEGQTNFPDIAGLQGVEDFLPIAQGLSAYGQIGEHLSAYLRTLQSTNRFTVLSRPSVFTMNNRKAVVATGQRIAVPVSTLSTVDPNQVGQAISSSIDYRDVVLKLEVIPLINADDEVTLQISQINDDIVGSTVVAGNEIPTIGTQEITTTVIVPDRSTVLLGGLVSEGESETVSGLPLFTKIPLLRHVFGSTSKSKDRRELVIFIQPVIIKHPSDIPSTMLDQHRRTEITQDAYDFANPQVRELSQRPLLSQPVRVHGSPAPPRARTQAP